MEHPAGTHHCKSFKPPRSGSMPINYQPSTINSLSPAKAAASPLLMEMYPNPKLALKNGMSWLSGISSPLKKSEACRFRQKGWMARRDIQRIPVAVFNGSRNNARRPSSRKLLCSTLTYQLPPAACLAVFQRADKQPTLKPTPNPLRKSSRNGSSERPVPHSPFHPWPPSCLCTPRHQSIHPPIH